MCGVAAAGRHEAELWLQVLLQLISPTMGSRAVGRAGPGEGAGPEKSRGTPAAQGRGLALCHPPQDRGGHTCPKPVPASQCRPAPRHRSKLPACPGLQAIAPEPRAAVLRLVTAWELRAAQDVHRDWHGAVGRHGNGALSWGRWQCPKLPGGWALRHGQHTSVGLTRMRDDAQSPLEQNPGHRMCFLALSRMFWHLSYHQPP